MQFIQGEHNPYLEHSSFAKSRWSVVADMLESLIIAALICGFVYIFVFTPNVVHGPSMFPTFKEGQLVLTTSRIAHWLSDSGLGTALGLDYGRGDIVVFHTVSGEDLIKRIIAIPGDKIAINRGNVIINGEQIDEPYLEDSVKTNSGSYLSEGEELLIPEGFYFVMGDNRTQSRDSRDMMVGLVKQSSILGKVVLRYWPLADFTIIRPAQAIT